MVSGVGEVVVGDRFDITVEAVSRAAWRAEQISLTEAALRRMDECAAAFDALVQARVRADPEALIYGVTSAGVIGRGWCSRRRRRLAGQLACGRRCRMASRYQSG
jgi:histidine ammonia-lyase